VLYWQVDSYLSLSATDSLLALASYELQVEPKHRGRGAGKLLMEMLFHIAKDWKMDKVMLTVFKCMFAHMPGVV
jgi:GNAT superfamily N-acetyltransferase